MESKSFYGHLNTILPRYLRVHPSVIEEDELQNLICSLVAAAGAPVHVVDWAFREADAVHDSQSNVKRHTSCPSSPVFLALPGYVSISQLEPIARKLYPMDIASAFAVLALGLELNIHQHSTHVLDMCCCPGGKLHMISDILEAQAEALLTKHTQPEEQVEGDNAHQKHFAVVTGVDISENRLSVCKSISKQWCSATSPLCSTRESIETSNSLHAGEMMENAKKGRTVSPQHRSVSKKPRMPTCEEIISTSVYPVEQQIFQCDGTLFCQRSAIDSTEGLQSLTKSKSNGYQIGRLVYSSTLYRRTNVCHAFSRSSPAVLQALEGIEVAGKGGVGAKRRRENKSAKMREQRLLSELFGSIAAKKYPEKTSSVGLDDRFDGARDGYDFVLVDAECSHDGSYRHMPFVAPSGEADLTDGHSSNEHSHIEAADASTQTAHAAHSDTMSSPSSSYRKHKASQRFEARCDGDELEGLQRGLLSNGFALLKPNGALVYSTCSMQQRQNDGIITWFLEHHPDAELEPVYVKDFIRCSTAPSNPSETGLHHQNGPHRESEIPAMYSSKHHIGSKNDTHENTGNADHGDSVSADVLALLRCPPDEFVARVEQLSRAAVEALSQKVCAFLSSCEGMNMLIDLHAAHKKDMAGREDVVGEALTCTHHHHSGGLFVGEEVRDDETRGMLCLSRNLGMSGLFVARIRKKLTHT